MIVRDLLVVLVRLVLLDGPLVSLGTNQQGRNNMGTNRNNMPTTYAEIDAALGDRKQITLCNNTKAERLYNGDIEVKLHGHTIAQLYPRGNVWVCDAGYVTVTTYDRLKRLLAPLGAMTYRRKGTGYVRLRNGQEFCLSDVIRLAPDGESAFSGGETGLCWECAE